MADLRLIWKPTVRLVGVQAVESDAIREFLADRDASGWATDAPSAAEELCEHAGRICYRSHRSPRPGGNSAYLEHILDSKHGRIAEHAVFSFILEGVSRSLTHELYTHAVGISRSMESQRFVDSSDVGFVIPPALEGEVRAYLAWCKDEPTRTMDAEERIGCRWFLHAGGCLGTYKATCDHLFGKYSHIPDCTARRKAAREAARSVLPNCTATTVFVTINGRAARHLLQIRGSEAADAEFRRLAVEWLRVIKPAAPNLFSDCSIVPTDDGLGRVEVVHSKA